MNKISTPKEVQVSATKKIQTSLGPKLSTLEFLRNFARAYDPAMSGKMNAELLLN